jgi:hypothetical protein
MSDMAYRGTFASSGDDAGARRLVEAQLFDAGAAIVIRHPVEEPVLVRPVVGELMYDWMAALETEMGGEGGGVVCVTAAEPTLAAAIARDAAVWLGDRGRRVTLVDGSVSAPAIGKALMEDGDEGLVDAVVFGVSPRAVARRTLASGIRLVTAGSYPVSARAVFESEDFAPTLRAFRDDGVVIVALDSAHIDAALPAFSAVVVAGRSEREVEAIGRTVGTATGEEPPRRVALIVSDDTHVPEETERPAAAAEAEAPAPADVAAVSRGFETERVTDASTPGEPTREEPVEAVSDGAAPSETPAEEEPEAGAEEAVAADLEREQERDRELGFATEDAERRRTPEHHPPVVMSAERPRRRRPIGVILTVLVLALVPVVALIWWRASIGTGELQPEEGPEIVAAGPESPGEPPGGGADAEQEEASVSGEDDVAKPAAQGAAQEERPGQTTERPAGQQQEEQAPTTTGPAPESSPAETLTPEGLVRGPGGPYFVFVSSHKHEAAARTEGGELESRGYESAVMSAEVPDRGTWHRVAIAGGYPSFSSAREVLDRVKELGYEGAWVQRVSRNE